MAQTYAQLQDQISTLQVEAARLKKDEFAAIVAKMRDDIKVYEITPQDLFGKAARQIGTNKSKSASQAKYGDGTGNVWVGRGPRPKWLRDALAAGKKLEEFVAGAFAAKVEPSAAKTVKKAKAANPAAKKTAPKKKAGDTKTGAATAGN